MKKHTKGQGIVSAEQTVRCTMGPVSIDGVRIDGGDAWLTQRQIATLFEVDRKTATEHIRNILHDGECKPHAVSRNFQLTVPSDRGRTQTRNIAHYSTDMVMAVGYRVRSPRGIEFRQWVTSILKSGGRPSLGPVPPLLRDIVREEQMDEHGIVWVQEFLKHMCKLYGKPYDGRQPRWLASVYRRLYDRIAGSEVMQEIKRRNPEPRFGQNHHQWFTPRARDAMNRQVGVITTLAKQSATVGEFWARVDYEYGARPLQLGFGGNAK